MKKFLLMLACCAAACGCSENAGGARGGISGADAENFKNPPKECYPETWFHLIGGNVSREGLTADLEAIARAKIAGVQLFHGKFGGKWPNTGEEIQCLSPQWEGFVKFAAEEARRLGLNFSMQNCPGWSMSGGPWIEPKNAMRHITHTRADVEGAFDGVLPPPPNLEPWRDYRDIAVLAFPTPLGDTGEYIKVLSAKGSGGADWRGFFKDGKIANLKPSNGAAHWFEVEIPRGSVVRTVEIPSTGAMTKPHLYDPRVKIKIDAILSGGKKVNLAARSAKASNWQDSRYKKIYSASIACPEVEGIEKIRVEIENEHPIRLHYVKFSGAARKNSWESEAGWQLRAIDRDGDGVRQNSAAYVDAGKIIDISANMSADGRIKWTPPSPGKWTILRIGHVNTGKRNAPAPAEATGWECDKLAAAPLEIHFNNYIGKLANGALKGGLLKRMVLDSWECETQTWTPAMESEFETHAGYKLRRFLPALFGYVVGDPEKTALFLLDWRANIGRLLAQNYFAKMAELARKNNLEAVFETASGDVFPADIMEYFKFTNTPMCEFWQPLADSDVGSLNFKPIKPTASAARLYGKKRISAEAFTSVPLSWDDRWRALREVANVNIAEGVTHLVFHTYTHNPQVGFLKPGTSFGSHIGTAFLRGQAWWDFMPAFTTYFARNTYMLERGRIVSDVLWYLGDEIRHKPDQNYPFPEGFKYDYCNCDVLMNRLDVRGGRIVTPEGLEYKVLWLDDCRRMRPETLEKILELVRKGATVVGEPPRGIATLSGGISAKKRFEAAAAKLWRAKGETKIGLGRVVSGVKIGDFVKANFAPRAKGARLPLWLHRRAGGDDIFFVAAPAGGDFKGDVSFKARGDAEIWNAVDGSITPVAAARAGEYETVRLELPRGGSCFVVFRGGAAKAQKSKAARTAAVLDKDWTLSFPEGWGAPKSIKLPRLMPWKDLPISDEGRAFSGKAVYTATFNLPKIDPAAEYVIDLGSVEMAARVMLNGAEIGVAWCEPFALKLGGALKQGANELRVEVASTWFNRLAYDAALPEAQRKTWTIAPPKAGSPLRESGLLGPVKIVEIK